MHSGLEILGFLGLNTELFHNLLVIIWEVTLEYFIDVRFLHVL